jgi:hypothetical protein
MPYYTGIVAHRPSGSLESAGAETVITQLDIMLRRISINEPAGVGPAVVKTMWLGYVCATLSLLAAAAWAVRSREDPAH